MNRRAVLEILGGFAATAPSLLAQESTEKKKVHTADELKALLDKEKPDLFILDVREPKEIEELGTLEGYVNIPVGEIEKRQSEIPKGKPLVVVCNRGVRAARAAETLSRNGHEVRALGGLLEWKEKNYPLIYPKSDAFKEAGADKKK